MAKANMDHKLFTVFALFAAVCIQFAQCKHWALLVAGSSGYYNYRHQADICHAYHIMKNNGIPAENIVTMMYDDIADNTQNPFKGNIINQPNGPNVYPGVVIDYKKEDVTPEVFLAVLAGNEKEVQKLTGHKGKVIKSGPEDHVFVNFADHGGPGILGFPSSTLSAKDLQKTVTSMHSKKSYKKMVFYVEACYAGSMFANLLRKDINVYATTAANPDQSSYACYFDKKRDTYLGDVYSVNWMQDSDKEDLKTETLYKQYTVTKKRTNTSQVMQYGDLSMNKMTVAEFQGNQAANRFTSTSSLSRQPSQDAVPGSEVAERILQHQLVSARTLSERLQVSKKIRDLKEYNSQIENLFMNIAGRVEQSAAKGDQLEDVLRFTSEQSYQTLKQERRPITQWECYTHAVDVLNYSCPNMKMTQSYKAMGLLHVLVNLCERGHPERAIIKAVVTSAIKSKQLCAAE